MKRVNFHYYATIQIKINDENIKQIEVFYSYNILYFISPSIDFLINVGT